MNDETILYRDESVLISNSRAVLGNTVYAVSNLASVRSERRTGNIAPGLAIAIVGVIVFACGGFGLLERGSWLSWIWGILGLGAIVAGVYAIATTKAKYVMVVGLSSGEKAALESQDQAYIAAVTDALNKAIAKR